MLNITAENAFFNYSILLILSHFVFFYGHYIGSLIIGIRYMFMINLMSHMLYVIISIIR